MLDTADRCGTRPEVDARTMMRRDPSMRIVAMTAALAAVSWCWSTASGSTPLEVAGDESGRILESYAAASPAGMVELLTTADSWTWIHPPGDIAFRASMNGVLGAVTDDPDVIVRMNQLMATMLVVVGIGAMAAGLRVLSGVAVAAFLALAIPSASVIYVAHHALGENLAIALVGLGAALLLRDRHVGGGLLTGMAGLVRPEFALVFATLAAIPFAARRFRGAATFAMIAIAPTVAHTIASDLTGTSYASVDLFPNRSLFDVAFSGRGPEVYWGLGISPWLAAATAAVLLMAGVWARVPILSAGRLLIAGWSAWTLLFALMAARGAIPTQIRTYVALHVIGALAFAVAAHEVFVVVRPAWGRVVAVAAAGAIAAAVFASAETRREWRNAYPSDVAAVSTFLADARNEAGLLTDWSWWREWTFGVYGTAPGGDVCNYRLCAAGSDAAPPEELTEGLSNFQADRLTQAWRFVAAGPPRFIVMFNDQAYQEWRAWEGRAHPETLSSFVRPLLSARGDCFVTAAGLPPARYCTVFRNGRYTVLESDL